jgi:His-Xaa-Ser system radical SAM maturase HxsC
MKTLNLDIETKCNNNCLMCIAPKLDFEITFDHIKNMIDKNKEINEIYLTGGEPTISKHLFKTIDYIKEKNSNTKINIVTNGRMMSNTQFIEKLHEKGIQKFILEIHGDTQKLHEIITQTPKSFIQTIKGIKNIVSLDLPFEIRILVHKLNYKELKNISRLIAEKYENYNKLKVVLMPISYVNSAEKNKEKLFVSLTTIIEYIQKAIDILNEKNIAVKVYHIPFCFFEKRYWKYINEGITTKKINIYYPKECEKCSYKIRCPGVWASYNKINKLETIRPITE